MYLDLDHQLPLYHYNDQILHKFHGFGFNIVFNFYLPPKAECKYNEQTTIIIGQRPTQIVVCHTNSLECNGLICFKVSRINWQ